jgi:hypothetical protein
MSLPGVTGTGSGNRTFGGGGSGPGGSRPGSRPGPAGDSVRVPVVEGQRVGAAITAPRSGKMVYILVAVLIAAICVLAALLFSGETPRRPAAGAPSAGAPR